MLLRPIKPLTPQQRSRYLGLKTNNFNQQRMSQTTLNMINYIKKKDRSSLKLQDWNKKNYCYTDAIQQLFECPNDVQREDMENLSLSKFTEKYQKTNTVVVIKGCTDKWNTSELWTHQYFYENYRDVKFKVGEDDDGYKLQIPFQHYLQYLIYNQDDSPLYLFESSLESKEETQPIIDNYVIPPYFNEDLFKLAGQKKRPPYRWFIMGPERSGTTIHKDPLDTSAWNSSLRGHKRWVLFDQSIPKSIAKGKEFREKHYEDEAINYFVQILPKIKQKYSKEELKISEFIQYPGQTVFVPGGMWHAVINLDDTIAVTQNVMTNYCFDKVWCSTRCQRRKFAEFYLERLRQQNCQLYSRAIELNQGDNYEMGQKYCQQEVSLSFTPSSSSSASSSTSSHPDSDVFDQKIEKDNFRNRENRVQMVKRVNSKRSSLSKESLSRSRQKRVRTTFSQQKRPLKLLKLKQFDI